MAGSSAASSSTTRPLAPIPVVVVSGTKDAARSAADLGAAACLEKPVEFNELVAVVREHCGLRHRPAAVPACGQAGRPPALGVGPGKSVRVGVSHALRR